MTCSKCGTPLSDGNRYARSRFCLGCVGAPKPAAKPDETTEIVGSEAAAHLVAQVDAPPPASPPGLDGEEGATAARIAALGNGHAVSVPATVPAGRGSEEDAAAARIAALANGRTLPAGNDDGDDAETRAYLARMKALDEGNLPQAPSGGRSEEDAFLARMRALDAAFLADRARRDGRVSP